MPSSSLHPAALVQQQQQRLQQPFRIESPDHDSAFSDNASMLSSESSASSGANGRKVRTITRQQSNVTLQHLPNEKEDNDEEEKEPSFPPALSLLASGAGRLPSLTGRRTGKAG